MPFKKIDALSHPIASLPDRMDNEAAFLKRYFDGSPTQLMAAHNDLIDTLEATGPGMSGAETIGSAPIAGLPGNTVHSQLAKLKSLVDAASSTGITPGSITPDMLSPLLAVYLGNPLISATATSPYTGRYVLTPACTLDYTGGNPHHFIFMAPTAAATGHTLVIEGYGTTSIPVVDRAGSPVAAGAWGIAAPVEVCFFGGRAYLR